jgi:hypothetical protein
MIECTHNFKINLHVQLDPIRQESRVFTEVINWNKNFLELLHINGRCVFYSVNIIRTTCLTHFIPANVTYFK